MQVFIYRHLFEHDIMRQHNAQLVAANNLEHQYQYVADFLDYFSTMETRNPDEADFFFIPLFLAGWQFINHDPKFLLDAQCPFLDRGNHIIVATGDFGQRAISPHEMKSNPDRAYRDRYPWLDERFILLALESTDQLFPRDIAFLPYQISPVAPVTAQRDIFLSFMGHMTQKWLEPHHMRGGRLIEFRQGNADPSIVIGTPEEVRTALGGPFSYHEVMARSVFTLCPAGYGRWTFRLPEALQCGSIPVLLSDGYVLPFGDEIDWSRYVIAIPERDLDRVPDLLGEIPIRRILEMQNEIRRNRPLFEKAFTLQATGRRLERLAEEDRKDPANGAIRRMRGPSQMHIICIDVTNKCDLACSNCTRLLENQDHFWEMSAENFRLALRSLKDFPGIIAMIGGNPCMHSRFADLCQVFVEEIPNQRQRGLWSNNIFKHRELIEQTFGGLNLNPHDNVRATQPLKDLYKKMVVEGGFNGAYHEGGSDHSPILTAVKDFFPPAEMWEKISNCDVNREWSATIVQNKGELRAYFCEVAASFDLARGEDHGIPVTEGWWLRSIRDFSPQVKHFCPGCGVPARFKGHRDSAEIDTYSISNADLAKKSALKKKRAIVLMESEELEAAGHKFTKYSENAV